MVDSNSKVTDSSRDTDNNLNRAMVAVNMTSNNRATLNSLVTDNSLHTDNNLSTVLSSPNTDTKVRLKPVDSSTAKPRVRTRTPTSRTSGPRQPEAPKATNTAR